MVQALLLDFSWVILHPADRSYEGKLNDLNRRLAGGNPLAPYDFSRFFVINDELLKQVEALKAECNLGIYMFTTDIIQERPEVQAKTTGLFDRIFTAREFVEQGVSLQDYNAVKTEPKSFRYIAGERNLAAQSILYIDDTLQNLHAAQEAGYQTIQYKKLGTMHESNAALFHELEAFMPVAALL